MQATLIFNPFSGGSGRSSPEELIQALSQAGYDPVYRATGSEEDLDPVLEDIEGLVVVAGGDGSVRAVATRLIGKKVPLALIPNGTANNISRALGMNAGPLDLIAGLRNPRVCHFDVGRVRAPWGEDYFLEAAGYGLYADTLAIYRPDYGKSVLRSIEAVRQTVSSFQTEQCAIHIDGNEVGDAYILFEVLNTPAFGPRLKVVPQADPADGWLDVLRIRENVREGFLAYVTSLLNGGLADLESVEVSRARKVEITWTGFPIHVDGEVRPKPVAGPEDEAPVWEANPSVGDKPQGSKITMEIIPQALEIWLPDGAVADHA
jgi:diacylglycerol kinase family enzyme